MNANALVSFLNQLAQKGILSNEANDQIQSKIQTNNKFIGKLFLYCAAISGLLFFLTGLSIIFEYFWSDFHQHVQGVISFFPVIIGIAVYIYILKSKKDSTSLKEAASVFAIITIGISMTLFTSTYKTGENVDLFIAIWLMLSLPFLYIYKSSLASLYYILLMCRFIWPHISFSFGIIPTGYSANEFYYLFWVFLLAFLPQFYLGLNKKSKQQNLRSIILGWVICLLLLFTLPLALRGGYLWWTLSMAMAFYLTGKKYFSENSTVFGRPFQTVALYILLYAFLLLAGDMTSAVIFELDGLMDIRSWDIHQVISYGIGALLLGTLSIIGLIKARKNKSLNRYVIGVPFLFVFLLFSHYLFKAFDFDIRWFAFLALYLHALGFSIGAISKGHRSNNPLYMLYGFLLTTGMIWNFFIDTDMYFWVQALFCFAIGAIYFVMHYLSVEDFEGEN